MWVEEEVEVKTVGEMGWLILAERKEEDEEGIVLGLVEEEAVEELGWLKLAERKEVEAETIV